MSLPQPPTRVEGHCSAIVDNVLYVYEGDSFLSLPLKEKAQWSKEKVGVPVRGPACALAGEGANASLFVVGGKTDNNNYSGLQVYRFAQKKWESLDVTVPVLKGRTDHNVAYLADSQQILIYAGSTPDTQSYLSSQTFTVSTQSPYNLDAYTSRAPPGHFPIVESFNSSHAIMLGGSDTNRDMWTFGPSGWDQYPVSLNEPVDSTSRATVVDGSDGSKVLQLYDVSVSPNTISQIVLVGQYGQTAFIGQTIGSQPSSRKRKRDLTLGNWPEYNDQNAPTERRADCGLAQSSDGLAVISGGSSESPVALFNQDRNSWVDADKFFNSKQRQQPLQPSKTASKNEPTSTTSSTPSSTTTAAAGGSGGNDHMLRTLGITLGVLCGIAVIFILVLLYLRWRKMKKRKAEGWIDEKDNDKGGRLSFQDRGASFMKEAGGSVNDLALPQHKRWNNDGPGSHSSLAIITGKFNGKRNTGGHEPKPSYDSTAGLVRDRNGNLIDEPMEMVDLDEKKIERKPVARVEPTPPSAQYGPTLTTGDANMNDRRNRSSGWSKYFATSQPTGPHGLSHLPSAYANKSHLSDASVYSNDRPSRIPSSAQVAPLDIDFSKTIDGQRLSHVTSFSPAINDSRSDLAQKTQVPSEGQQGLIVTPRRKSESETISSYNRSTMSSTDEYYNDSANQTTWTPTSQSFKDHLNNRPSSSVYANSEPRLPSRGKNSGGFFPGAGTVYRPPPKAATKSKMGHAASPSADWADLNSPLQPPKPAADRDSTITVFPKGVPSAYYEGREKENEPAKPINSDLGWLNLGLNNNNNNNQSQNRL